MLSNFVVVNSALSLGEERSMVGRFSYIDRAKGECRWLREIEALMIIE